MTRQRQRKQQTTAEILESAQAKPSETNTRSDWVIVESDGCPHCEHVNREISKSETLDTGVPKKPVQEREGYELLKKYDLKSAPSFVNKKTGEVIAGIQAYVDKYGDLCSLLNDQTDQNKCRSEIKEKESKDKK